MTERMYPLQGYRDIPWGMIAPYDFQAKRNHCGQSLEDLARRCGTCPIETYYILRGEAFPRSGQLVTAQVAKAYIDQRISEYNGFIAIKKQNEEMSNLLEEMLQTPSFTILTWESRIKKALRK